MTIPDPPWKQKTRPCPFYSQGRCLFSDSCNFLHDVKIKVKQPHITITDSTPDVIVSSPRASSVTTSPTTGSLDVRSPPRSPRLSSLLLALGDTIQTEEDEYNDDSTSLPEPPLDDPPPVVASNDIPVAEEFNAEETEGIVSPSSSHPLETEREEFVEVTQTSSDDVDRASEPSDLLSPIEVKLGQLDGPSHREDSIDSGYADNWTGPSPFALSPPKPPSSRRYSTLSLLSSPFGSPVRALSPKFGPSAGSGWPSSPLFSPVISKTGSRTSSLRLSQISDDLDSPTDYDRGRFSAGSPTPSSCALDEDVTVRRSPLAVSHDDLAEQTVVPPKRPLDTTATPLTVKLPERVGSKPSSSTLVGQSESVLLEGSSPTQVQLSEKVLSQPSTSTLEGAPEPIISESPSPTPVQVPENVIPEPETSTFADVLFEGSSPKSVQLPEQAVLQPSTSTFAGPPESAISEGSSPTPVQLTEQTVSQSSTSAFAGPPESAVLEGPSPTPVQLPNNVAANHSTPVLVGLNDEISSGHTVSILERLEAAFPKPLTSASANSSGLISAPVERLEEAESEPLVLSATDEGASSADDESCTAEAYIESAVLTQSNSSLLEEVLEEDTTDLYSGYYSEALYTNSPRNVELFASSPVVHHTDSRSVMSPSPSVQRSSSLESEPPEFVAGSSKDTYTTHSVRSFRTQSPIRSIRPPSPRKILAARDSPPGSRQSSLSQEEPINQNPRRTSTKVPFGFRHSIARSREPVTSRPGSAPPIRHRPPALVGLSSGRSQSMNDNSQIISPEEPLSSSRSSSRLRPLRLSILLNSSTSSFLSPISSTMPPAVTATSFTDYSQPSSPSVKSDYSLSHNPLLSATLSEHIPHSNSAIASSFSHSQSLDEPHSLPLSAPPIHHASAPWNNAPKSPYKASSRLSYISRPSSRLSERSMQPPIHEEEPLVSYHDNHEDEAEGQYNPPYDPDVTKTVRPVVLHASPPHSPPQQTLSPQQSQHGTLSLPVSIALSLPHSPVHAIATPRPTLLFAIASDDPAEVRRVLESGDASPNDDVGPQSALAFALTSGQLKNRTEMVKLLLAYGADPASVKRIGAEEDERTSANPSGDGGEENGEEAIQNIRRKSVDPLEAADPATRYYIARAEAPQTRRASALIHRSFFRPLTKVRYEMIGQDRALEQLFRVLSMPSMAPIVVLLCGPSGHGKSLLARRFGSLLDVPTHTVNMTTLRSTHDIWRSYSMSPYEEPSSLTLADFLLENEGKRCVVVLDEIEKTENDTILSSLLMPWELGRCSFEAGHRHVNVSKVIWLGTSNIGHDLVFEHQSSRIAPAEPMTRDEYVDLMGILRPVVSDRLGPSLLSRVTTVLPFVPFTVEEKLAIAAEALFSLAEDAATRLPAATVEKLVKDSLKSYVPAEGARSLYRAVSAQLLDTL